MRQALDRNRLLSFLRYLGAEAREEASLYITGGGTAVLLGGENARSVQRGSTGPRGSSATARLPSSSKGRQPIRGGE